MQNKQLSNALDANKEVQQYNIEAIKKNSGPSFIAALNNNEVCIAKEKKTIIEKNRANFSSNQDALNALTTILASFNKYFFMEALNTFIDRLDANKISSYQKEINAMYYKMLAFTFVLSYIEVKDQNLKKASDEFFVNCSNLKKSLEIIYSKETLDKQVDAKNDIPVSEEDEWETIQ